MPARSKQTQASLAIAPVGIELLHIVQLAEFVVDQLDPSCSEIDQHIAVLGCLDLEILKLCVLVPGLCRPNSRLDFLIDVHDTNSTRKRGQGSIDPWQMIHREQPWPCPSV